MRVWAAPSPKMQYAEVPVDGANIRLEVERVCYGYHAAGARPEPFL
jgi:hypothetical protein